MENKFKILDAGNFYFPFIDKRKRFIVEDTIEITLNVKDTKIINLCLQHPKNPLRQRIFRIPKISGEIF